MKIKIYNIDWNITEFLEENLESKLELPTELIMEEDLDKNLGNKDISIYINNFLTKKYLLPNNGFFFQYI